MKNKFFITTLIVVFIIALLSVVYYKYNTPKLDYIESSSEVKIRGELITWDNAIEKINSGNVSKIHLVGGSAIIILKDKTEYTTHVPPYTRVLDYIEDCGEKCNDIVISME